MIIHHIDFGVMRLGLLFFITIPVLEMYILILVGSQIGALTTIGLVVLTATLGLWLFRREGFSTLQSLQNKLNGGEIPGRELLEGVMLLVGGALLLTPGFVTDGIGFICLLPAFRKPIAEWLIRRGMLSMTRGFTVHSSSAQWQHFEQHGHAHPDDKTRNQNQGQNHTFDGEFTEHANPDANKINRDTE